MGGGSGSSSTSSWSGVVEEKEGVELEPVSRAGGTGGDVGRHGAVTDVRGEGEWASLV